ncbi:hypothetical protein MASR1M74_22650 [Lentimicrobium sp.]
MKFNTFRLYLLVPIIYYLMNALTPVMAQQLNAEQLHQFEEAILRGEELLNSGKYAEAKAQYQAALKIDPNAQYPKDKLSQIRKVYIDPADEARFTGLMKTGEQRMSEENYAEALKAYEAAVDIKPEDKTAREKMQLASKKTIELAERSKNYDLLIKKADQLYAGNQMQQARETYVSASELLPAQGYPHERIKEIDDKIAAELKQKQLYDGALTNGDEAYMNRDFVAAKIYYEQALKLKPGESYPRNMLERVAAGSEQLIHTQQQYEQTIATADRLMDSGAHQEALTAYESASRLRPDEAYPKNQLKKISEILQQKQDLERDYQQAISEGDRLLASQQFTEARTHFQRANNLKPDEKYPRQKIEEIARELLALKDAEREKAYRSNIEVAEKLLAEENLGKALTAFQEAQKLKPEENLPAQRIQEINKRLAEEQAAVNAYNKVIAQADEYLAANDHNKAKEAYQQALKFQQNDKYALAQIEKIDLIIAENKIKEADYQRFIDAGDLNFTNSLYAEAKANYASALKIFPNRSYAESRLKEAENKMSELQSQEEQFNQLIAEGDKNFTANQLQKAASAYSAALQIKPEEAYAQEQLVRIEQLLQEKAARQLAYDNAITLADGFLKEDNFEQALSNYKEAKKLMPEQGYPDAQIAQINTLLEERKSLEDNFNRYLAEGDKALENKKYADAKQAYERALKLKPNQKYASGQIQLIEKALTAEKVLNENYQEAIDAADRLFASGKFEAANLQYESALKVKPGEAYPLEQQKQIAELLKNEKQRQDAYVAAVTLADKLFEEKKYSAAREEYVKSLELQPGAAHPTERIVAIDVRVGEQQELEQRYATALAEADNHLNNSDLDEAMAAYRRAKDIKPAEKYPDEQLKRIAELKEKEQQMAVHYSQSIKSGDAFFQSGAYTEALTAYQRALESKPGAEYPSARIKEIDVILQEQKQLADKDYNEAIQTADELFAEKDFTSSVRFYEKASALKPEQNYPKEKLITIRTLLQERARNQMEAYNKLIMNADRLYQDKIFDQAIEAYLEAGLAKPDEAYPSNMIIKIRKYLEDHAMVSLVSSPVDIASGDEKKFNFNPIEMRLRKNNYVSIVARKTGEDDPKVYVNYGKDNQKNGGIVLRNITSDENNDFLVRVSIQDRWYREDNNWISIYSEGGGIEISRMQIAQGD